MGKHFGELTKVRGMISYSLSPYEQRAFAGVLSKGLPNVFKRIYSQVFRVVPPFIVGYLIYDYGTKEHERLQRKDPAAFVNDS